jgi:hypothetical protein
VLTQGVGYAPIWVPTPYSYQFYGVVNEMTVLIEKKRADKISCGTGDIIELTVHKEQTSVA